MESAFLVLAIAVTGIVCFLSTRMFHAKPAARPPLRVPAKLWTPRLTHSSSLHVFCGPMFCGKTTRLVHCITSCADVQNERPLLINFVGDTRDRQNIISSHASSYKGLSSSIDVKSASRLADVDVSGYNVIGVDEAQFFPDLESTIKRWISNKDSTKHVYVAGLDSDSNMHSFGHVDKLLYMSDYFQKMRSVCTDCLTLDNCHTDAPFTCRVLSSSHGRAGPKIDIGGREKYKSVCRRHFDAAT